MIAAAPASRAPADGEVVTQDGKRGYEEEKGEGVHFFLLFINLVLEIWPAKLNYKRKWWLKRSEQRKEQFLKNYQMKQIESCRYTREAFLIERLLEAYSNTLQLEENNH